MSHDTGDVRMNITIRVRLYTYVPNEKHKRYTSPLLNITINFIPSKKKYFPSIFFFGNNAVKK